MHNNKNQLTTDSNSGKSSNFTSATTGAKIVPNNCKNDFDYFLR